jgi:hypothetical protein
MVTKHTIHLKLSYFLESVISVVYHDPAHSPSGDQVSATLSTRITIIKLSIVGDCSSNY